MDAEIVDKMLQKEKTAGTSAGASKANNTTATTSGKDSEKRKRYHEASELIDAEHEDGAADEEVSAPSTPKKTGGGGGKKPPQKPQYSPYFYPGEEKWHQEYLAKHPPRDKSLWDNEEGAKKLFEELNSDLLKGADIPSGWKIEREASSKPADIEYRKRLNESQNWSGKKREPDQSNEKFLEEYEGLRLRDFTECFDTQGRSRWLLSIRDFPQIPGATATHRSKLSADENLKLYIEPSAGFLNNCGELTARIYNQTATELFDKFRGLIPELLILHKIRNSSYKKRSTNQAKAAKKQAEGEHSTAADRDAAVSSLTSKDLVSVYDRETLLDLSKAAKEAASRIEGLKKEAEKLSTSLPAPHKGEDRNGWEAVFTCIYRPENPEDTEKRRKFMFGSDQRAQQEGPGNDEALKIILDLGKKPDQSEWKKKIEAAGGNVAKYIAGEFKTPGGKQALLTAFNCFETAGSFFNGVIKSNADAYVKSLSNEQAVVSKLAADLDALKKAGAQADDSNNKKFGAVLAAKEQLETQLAEAQARAEQLEKKLREAQKAGAVSSSKKRPAKDDSSSDSESSSDEKDKKKKAKKKASKKKDDEDEDEEGKHKKKKAKKEENSSEAEDSDEDDSKKKKKKSDKKKKSTKKDESSDEDEEEERKKKKEKHKAKEEEPKASSSKKKALHANGDGDEDDHKPPPPKKSKSAPEAPKAEPVEEEFS